MRICKTWQSVQKFACTTVCPTHSLPQVCPILSLPQICPNRTLPQSVWTIPCHSLSSPSPWQKFGASPEHGCGEEAQLQEEADLPERPGEVQSGPGVDVSFTRPHVDDNQHKHEGVCQARGDGCTVQTPPQVEDEEPAQKVTVRSQSWWAVKVGEKKPQLRKAMLCKAGQALSAGRREKRSGWGNADREKWTCFSGAKAGLLVMAAPT